MQEQAQTYLRHLGIGGGGKEDTLRNPTIAYESFSQETSIYWFTQISFIWYQNSELMSTLNANWSELLKETANLKVIPEWVSDLEQDFL